MTVSGLRTLLAGLIVVSAVAFAAGTALERSKAGAEAHTATVETSPAAGEAGGESPTGESGGETGHSGEASPAPGETVTSHASENILGFNPESTFIIVVVVLASLLLAFAVWKVDAGWPLWIAVAFGLIAAALDVREIVHQLNESRTTLAVVAALIGALHLAVSGVAIAALRKSPAPQTPTAENP